MTRPRQRLRRTVSKLLADTYRLYCAQGGTIHDAIYDVWEAGTSGESVMAEAFASLEQAARDVSEDSWMDYCQLEDRHTKLVKPMFERAVTITESKARSRKERAA